MPTGILSITCIEIMANNKNFIILCADSARFCFCSACCQSASGGGLSGGGNDTAITQDYASLVTSLSVPSRTHTRHILKSAVGCKERTNRLQPEGRLGLPVSDFPSSSFQGGIDVSPCLFVLAKVGHSGQTAKYRCTISPKFLQQPSSFSSSRHKPKENKVFRKNLA